jgi:hypothetical protein
MAATVSRERREKELKAMMMGAVLGGRMKRTVSDILGFLDDLDGAVTFFARRKQGTLLDLRAGEKVDRWEVTVRLSERMDRDPEFRAEMRSQPRYMTALSAHEAQGVPMVGFLGQVKEVHLVEEEPGLHWLLLPACHRGCEEIKKPEAGHEPGECAVCGRPLGAADSCASSPSSLTTSLNRIHAIDDYLVRAADQDRSFRKRLLADPTEAFAQATQALFGGRPEELFGIHEVRLAADTDTMLYCVHLADHEPKRRKILVRLHAKLDFAHFRSRNKAHR